MSPEGHPLRLGGKFHLAVNTLGPRQFCCENKPLAWFRSGAQGSEKCPLKVPSVGRGWGREQGPEEVTLLGKGQPSGCVLGPWRRSR